MCEHAIKGRPPGTTAKALFAVANPEDEEGNLSRARRLYQQAMAKGQPDSAPAADDRDKGRLVDYPGIAVRAG